MENTSVAPITYPTVEIGGETVELRKSFLSTYRLSKAGMGPEQLAEFENPKSGKRPYIVMELFASMARTPDHKRRTADEWAEILDGEKDPQAKFGQMTAACLEAMVKAPPVATAPATPAASAERPVN